jgi:hypothetical protein
MNIDPTNLTVYQNAMQQLRNLLNQSCDNAAGTDAANKLNGLANDVDGILTTLNQAGIAANTAQLLAIQPNVAAVNTKIAAVQAQLNNLVKDIGLAGQIAGVMDKAVQLAGKVFVA